MCIQLKQPIENKEEDQTGQFPGEKICVDEPTHKETFLLDNEAKYFQTTLWTGTGSSQSITNLGNSDMQPDLVWFKKRSGSADHRVQDSTRGVTKYLATNSDAADATYSGYITSFNSDGFSIAVGDGSSNTNAGAYVAWTWKMNGGTTMVDLKSTLVTFLKEFFEMDNIKYRFRPSYFPFTEPSAEMDVAFTKKNNVYNIGEGKDWLEILGCGMVNPRVLDNCKIDSTKYQGFAFGMGIERLSMLKYGINDARSFFDTNYKWLEHYGFNVLDLNSKLEI